MGQNGGGGAHADARDVRSRRRLEWWTASMWLNLPYEVAPGAGVHASAKEPGGSSGPPAWSATATAVPEAGSVLIPESWMSSAADQWSGSARSPGSRCRSRGFRLRADSAGRRTHAAGNATARSREAAFPAVSVSRGHGGPVPRGPGSSRVGARSRGAGGCRDAPGRPAPGPSGRPPRAAPT